MALRLSGRALTSSPRLLLSGAAGGPTATRQTALFLLVLSVLACVTTAAPLPVPCIDGQEHLDHCVCNPGTKCVGPHCVVGHPALKTDGDQDDTVERTGYVIDAANPRACADCFCLETALAEKHCDCGEEELVEPCRAGIPLTSLDDFSLEKLNGGHYQAALEMGRRATFRSWAVCASSIDQIRGKLTGTLKREVAEKLHTKPPVPSLPEPGAPGEPAIERNIHFVWVRPPPPYNATGFPDKVIQRVKGFGVLNPLWNVRLWTDYELTPELSAAVYPVRMASVYPVIAHYPKLVELVKRQRNVGGLSDVLRIFIVYKEGGLYIDTDSVPLRPFDSVPGLMSRPFASHTWDSYSNFQCSVFFFGAGSPFLAYLVHFVEDRCLQGNECSVMSNAGTYIWTFTLQEYQSPDIRCVNQRHLVWRNCPTCTPEGHVMYQSMDGSWVDRSK